MTKVSTILDTARNWLGKNEADGSHRQIIDIYNSHKPLARGYAVSYTDPWCATFVSALAIKNNATDTIPIECSCSKMIEIAKKKGIWIENEERVPNPGELCLYDWDDEANNFRYTDNKGYPEHIGIVEVISNGKIVVIEGNKNNAVERRILDINGRYIRGFIAPKYEVEIEIDTDKFIWDYLMLRINNIYGVAGLIGNLYAESALISNNAQNSGNKKLNMTDVEYTAAVDNGSYTNFVKDAIGYGLAQWTYWSRKESLLNFAKAKNKSIGDLEMQLEFLVQELSGYKSVYKKLINAKTIREASDAVLTEYERPADMSDSVKIKRANYGMTYFNKYAGKPTPSTTVINKKVASDPAKSFDNTLAGSYKVIAHGGLHMRNGAGVHKSSMIILPENTVVKNYGYYTTVLGTKWLYIQTTINGVQYTGFSSSKYLMKM